MKIETASIDFADLLRRWERNEPEDVTYVWQFVDYLIELASLRSHSPRDTGDFSKDSREVTYYVRGDKYAAMRRIINWARDYAANDDGEIARLIDRLDRLDVIQPISVNSSNHKEPK